MVFRSKYKENIFCLSSLMEALDPTADFFSVSIEGKMEEDE